MTNFINKELDVIKKLAEKGSNIPIITRPFHPDSNDTSPAAKYIKDDTIEYYYLGSDQYTVQVRDENINIHDILTDEGKNLFDKTVLRFSKNDYKDTFSTYITERSNSGFWSADTDSKYYKPEDPGTYLNSWNNISIRGLSDKNQVWLITSSVILLTNEWCLTRSGSLYKLGTNSLQEK